jgi:lipoprotein-releasing system permease protein
LTTVFSVLGVMAGVAVLNWVLAVMTGFEIDLRDKILGANAHVVVFRYGGNIVDYDEACDTVEAVDGVVAAAPFIYSEMMLHSSTASTGVVIKGVDMARTKDVTHIWGDLSHACTGEVSTPEQRDRVFADLAQGEFPAMGLDGEPVVTENEPLLPGIIIGKELREHLNVAPCDKIQLINPIGGRPGPMGLPTPTVRNLRVAAVFDSGMYEYDTKWTYLPNSLGQDFLNIGPTVNGIEVKVDDIDDVERISREIDEALSYPFYSKHWKTLNAKLFQALAMEKYVMFLLLVWIVVIAGLLIITTLFMLVITKGREIAIMKAMGATRASVLRIFMMEGATIGILGTVLGTILGLVGCRVLSVIEFPLETDVYYLSTLPVVVDPITVATIAISASLICFFFTLYPAWRAAVLDPVEALRYE